MSSDGAEGHNTARDRFTRPEPPPPHPPPIPSTAAERIAQFRAAQASRAAADPPSPPRGSGGASLGLRLGIHLADACVRVVALPPAARAPPELVGAFGYDALGWQLAARGRGGAAPRLCQLIAALRGDGAARRGGGVLAEMLAEVLRHARRLLDARCGRSARLPAVVCVSLMGEGEAMRLPLQESIHAAAEAAALAVTRCVCASEAAVLALGLRGRLALVFHVRSAARSEVDVQTLQASLLALDGAEVHVRSSFSCVVKPEEGGGDGTLALLQALGEKAMRDLPSQDSVDDWVLLVEEHCDAEGSEEEGASDRLWEQLAEVYKRPFHGRRLESAPDAPAAAIPAIGAAMLALRMEETLAAGSMQE
ncbi:hypothetical protein AB1Y20_014191 [Prymnesium parvum]|uniref:Protein transport protein SEC23 n=1 Tax=Prymnesium parvum TaxID=97485 RepID=A0AB34ID98_PRYPA